MTSSSAAAPRGHTPLDRKSLAGAHLSDAEVAGRVRMLMRTDLDHEAVCVMGRDRIQWLSAVNAELLVAAKRALNTLKAQGESVRPGNVLGALDAAIKLATGAP